jgi:hypothetical protein
MQPTATQSTEAKGLSYEAFLSQQKQTGCCPLFRSHSDATRLQRDVEEDLFTDLDRATTRLPAREWERRISAILTNMGM